jgi:hypothetical protein
MNTMSPTIQGIFFTVAVICFLLALHPRLSLVNFIAAGLAFYVFVYAWNAWAAS